MIERKGREGKGREGERVRVVTVRMSATKASAERRDDARNQRAPRREQLTCSSVATRGGGECVARCARALSPPPR